MGHATTPPQHPSFAEQPVPALLGIPGGVLPAQQGGEGLLPAWCVVAMLGEGRSATAGGLEVEMEARLEPQAGDRAGVAVVPLAQVAGLASSAGVWQKLVMLLTGPKERTGMSPGLAGCAGAVRGKGAPLGAEDCRCAHLS